MLLGRVIGTVTATQKEAALVGGALLVVALEKGSGDLVGTEIVALDSVGAGVGDRVLLATGSAARMASRASTAPVDASVIAIVDDVAVTAPT